MSQPKSGRLCKANVITNQ